MIWNVQFDVILCALFGGKIQTWSKSLQGVWLLKNTYLYLFKTSCITRKCILVTNRLCTDFRKPILKSRLACIYLLCMMFWKVKGKAFSKVKVPTVISPTFEFFRQKVDTKLRQTAHFKIQSISNRKRYISYNFKFQTSVLANFVMPKWQF